MTGAEPVKTDFVAFTWNACGMEKCAEQDLVDILDTEKVYWDAMLIQEGPISEKSGCKVVQGGHLFYVGPPGSNKRTACILLHRRWQQAKLSLHVVDERTVFLDLEAGALRLCLTSAHLPHGDALVEVYEAALEAVETVVARARKWRRMNVMGVDANAILGRQNETDDATIIGEHGVEQRNARGHIFVAWLHGQRLSAAATMRSKPWNETWTHELWNTKARRQIDYILFDEVRRDALDDVGIANCLEGKSDHRAAFVRLGLQEYKPIWNNRKRVQVGWKPKLDASGQPSQYHAAVDGLLSGFRSDIAETISEAAARSAEKCTRPERAHSAEVQELFSQRREEQDAERMKVLSKRLWKALQH